MKKTVGIFLFDDVEVLDFAGPFEVFSVTNELQDDNLLSVVTLAETSALVRAVNGLVVQPQFAMADAPPIDVLVVPGGIGSRRLLKNDAVLKWIEHRATEAGIVFSVCTGALVLAKLGLLDGLHFTTHHSAFDELEKSVPTGTLRRDVRFVDNGKIITAAGISAGLDASLYLVQKLFGADVATATATYMEYAWTAEEE
ncbi:MAG: DJ-1/PfpI family protein [Rhizobacter sp.]|nr:DJ-1/PfpI family protein [Chlorobiales bacterium]